MLVKLKDNTVQYRAGPRKLRFHAILRVRSRFTGGTLLVRNGLSGWRTNMSKPDAHGIELEEDRGFQEKFWSAERVAWAIFALIVIAALVGLTGQGGKLAHATVSGPTGTVEYPQITRWETSDELRLTLPPGSGDQATVEISSAFSEVFEFEDIQPAPSENYATAAGQRLIFDLAEPAGRREIVMHVRAMQPALSRRIQMRIDDGPALSFTPVVLP
jgi:hypothetical protein